MKTNRGKRNLSLLAVALGLTVTLPSFAQESAPNNSQQQRPVETQQAQANQDPLETLQLSGEQRAQIRAIREANRDERSAVNLRLRQAQMALEDALDADNPNESVIEQRAKDVGEAQAAAIRLRSLQEVRIRRVLTLEQQAVLRDLRFRNRQAEAFKRRQQRIQNQINQGRRPGNAPDQGNSVAPGPGGRRNVMQRKRP